MADWAERKVVVTGATGAVGKRLCPGLVDLGARAVVFPRDPAKLDLSSARRITSPREPVVARGAW